MNIVACICEVIESIGRYLSRDTLTALVIHIFEIKGDLVLGNELGEFIDEKSCMDDIEGILDYMFAKGDETCSGWYRDFLMKLKLGKSKPLVNLNAMTKLYQFVETMNANAEYASYFAQPREKEMMAQVLLRLSYDICEMCKMLTGMSISEMSPYC